ncbi:beta-ureidopropionase [Malassezia japonica]|uniref:Beta-ureidopropionase n=1 Tax=Malassezia japonica TaxID=223818 RepID=A0AAF0F499_9BASI|nr:beta-ureidopropionase [Malassezia japonica]WFD37988.1 beta-ureidopropionase [Malassezia japonica]
MKVAVAQLTSGGAIAENLAVAVRLIGSAAQAGAHAVFLPEATDFIAPPTEAAALTRSAANAEFVTEVCGAAKTHRVWVSVGVHEPPSTDEARCFNTQLLIDETGAVRERYRKLHLYDVDIQNGPSILESNTTIPGTELRAPVDTPVGKLGLLTCYDMRFPEVSLALRRQGAEILTYPSAFAIRTGAAHWSVLLQARAIETQCYVLAAAQVGLHPGTTRSSWGHAMIVDPWGSVVAQCSDMPPFSPTFCLADIDLTSLERVRRDMPLWAQRRSDVYGSL